MQLTKQQRVFLVPGGCDPKVMESILKKKSENFLNFFLQIKQQFGKNSKTYREEGTKRM